MSGGRRAYGGCVRLRQPDLPVAATRPSQRAMSKPDTERAERLAAALRDNLRRRKAQTRGEPASDEPKPASD